eukprot:gene20267-biopygen22098
MTQLCCNLVLHSGLCTKTVSCMRQKTSKARASLPRPHATAPPPLTGLSLLGYAAGAGCACSVRVGVGVGGPGPRGE